jgi:hypothetical protein
VKGLVVVKSLYSKRRASLVLGLCGLSALPFGCKDNDPCDPGQEFVSIGCFPVTGGSASAGKAGANPHAGAADDAGGANGEPSAGGANGEPSAGGANGVEPPGNPDAMFGTQCATNADCGGDAPVCATEPLFYCSQIDCQDGEANAGSCPADWVCFKYLDNPSACVNPSSF